MFTTLGAFGREVKRRSFNRRLGINLRSSQFDVSLEKNILSALLQSTHLNKEYHMEGSCEEG